MCTQHSLHLPFLFPCTYFLCIYLDLSVQVQRSLMCLYCYSHNLICIFEFERFPLCIFPSSHCFTHVPSHSSIVTSCQVINNLSWCNAIHYCIKSVIVTWCRESWCQGASLYCHIFLQSSWCHMGPSSIFVYMSVKWMSVLGIEPQPQDPQSSSLPLFHWASGCRETQIVS